MDFQSESDEDIDFINNIRAPKVRKFQDRRNLLEELDDNEFLRRFRIGKVTFEYLCNEIKHLISPVTNRWNI